LKNLKGRNEFGDFRRRCEDGVEVELKEAECEVVGRDAFGLGWDSVAGFCERGNETIKQ
jgi:hypothetical protein